MKVLLEKRFSYLDAIMLIAVTAIVRIVTGT